MKIVRKIDLQDGKFLEDVVFDGDLLPDDLIDKTIPVEFVNPYWDFDKKDWVDKPTDEQLEMLLNAKKTNKKIELKQAKENFLQKSITINNKNFFSTLEAYTKYQVAYQLGIEKGLTEGEVICLVDNKPTWIIVTKEEIEEYFRIFRLKGYLAERKLGELLILVEQAQTEDEVESIEWQDPVIEIKKVRTI